MMRLKKKFNSMT